jgi:glycosyltransferase involved in cell wall biosynthesis
MKITAAIITFNEEAKIEDALRSVEWADEVLVVDSGSTDRTRELVQQKGVRLLDREWTGFSDQKQFAADSASNDWILSLDADERVSKELKDEIVRLTASGGEKAGYTMPRLSYYMGRPIRHGGWYPDRQLRLFDRRHARWNGRVIHESVELIEGTAGELDHDILHYSVDNAAHHHRMIGERYAPLAARQMYDDGRRTSALRIAFAGPAAFAAHYIFRAGFLDGLPGYAIARFSAHHAYLKHLMLWELQNGPEVPSAE